MAHPGLALRTITWELIRDVLAGPCGLGSLGETEARELFNALAREVALVRQGDNADRLELRPELRRIVREDLTKDSKLAAKRMAIHTGAVAFYTQRGKPEDRAEEIYHRLAIGEDPGRRQTLADRDRAVLREPSVNYLEANAYFANRWASWPTISRSQSEPH